MPRVTVKFFASLQELAGAKTLEADVAIPSVFGLIEEISATRNRRLREAIMDEGGRLNPLYRIFVNGRSVPGDRLSSPLSEGDIVVIFPVVDGGGLICAADPHQNPD